MEMEMVDVQKLKKRFRTQAERNALARMFGTAAAACKPIEVSKPSGKAKKKGREFLPGR